MKTVIEMAREAEMGFDLTMPNFVAELERFAALVAAAEREACAKVCEGLSRANDLHDGAYACLEAIRARGQS